MGRKKKYKTKKERIDAKHQSEKRSRLKKKLEANRRCKRCGILITPKGLTHNSATEFCSYCIFAKQNGFKKTEDYFEHKIQEKQKEVDKLKNRYKDYLKLKKEVRNSSQD